MVIIRHHFETMVNFETKYHSQYHFPSSERKCQNNLRVSYQRKKLLTLREHMSSPPVFFVGSVMLMVLFFVLSYYVSLRSLVTCCDVRYAFRIKIMLGSSLPPVVCRKVYLRFLCLFEHSDGPTQIVLCFCFCLVFLRLVVSFFWIVEISIAPLELSNVYFKKVLKSSN